MPVASTVNRLSLRLSGAGVKKNRLIRWEFLQLDKHIPLLYQWVNLDYAKPFWQMDHLSEEEYRAHYEQVMQSGHSTSLIGYFKGEPVCQVEIYDCLHDEIRFHYVPLPGDYGLHFLMAPHNGTKVPGLSLQMMRSILDLLMAQPGIKRVFGEPDRRNLPANALVRKAGFLFIKPIQLSYKQANFYVYTV